MQRFNETIETINFIRYGLELLAIGVVSWILLSHLELKERLTVIETKQSQLDELKLEIKSLRKDNLKNQHLLIELKSDIKYLKDELWLEMHGKL